MENAEQDSYIRNLAKEIIDDIESERISGESLVLKALRLAKIAGSEETNSWLWYEKTGYNNSDPIAVKYIGYTKRKISQTGNIILYGSLAAQESAIETSKLKLEQLKHNPEPRKAVYGSNITMPTTAESIAGSIGYNHAIISAVRGLIHNFATLVYHERAFSQINHEIFQSYKLEIDKLLSASAGDALEKIPKIYERLVEGDREAVSQALTSCRRMIDSFADAVYPPTSAVRGGDGKEILLGSEQKKNRINQYVIERCESASRRTKLRQTLNNLYDRVSSGVHADVTLAEAKSLFLETYLLLGEIIGL